MWTQAKKEGNNVENKQSSIFFPLETATRLEVLVGYGWGTITNVIMVAVDRLYRRWKSEQLPIDFYMPVVGRNNDSVYKSMRLNAATVDQIEALRDIGIGSQQSIVTYAVDAMYDETQLEALETA